MAREGFEDPRREIPAVHRLWRLPEVAGLLDRIPRALVQEAIENVLDRAREELGAGGSLMEEELAARIRRRAEEIARPSLRRVINATGVVLHTNLGRAPLSPAARAAMLSAGNYTNLEFDLPSGRRGSRYVHLVDLLRRITGAPDAMVVNNNAAAVFLALRSLAAGREVVISRGELVEIGGSFRIPAVLAESGARLREVGTTNKTRLGDYKAAIGPETALILKVHQSNFRQVGFTASPPRSELAALAHEHGLPLLEDLGSGVLVDLRTRGLPAEPTVGESLRDGADLVSFSGDKLLGGPQAGILVGRADLVERLRQNPLTRALRVDKVTLAALSATLSHYLDPEEAWRTVPTLRLLSLTREEVSDRSRRLVRRLRRLLPKEVELRIEDDFSAAGGGSLPGYQLPTVVLAIRSPRAPALRLQAALRGLETPVIARVARESLLLDLRTVLPEDEDELVAALCTVLGSETAE